MPVSISINDRATPHIARLEDELNREPVRHAAGSSVMRLILDHLAALNAERPNALGGRRTNFYAKAAKSTSYAVTSDGATVSISKTGFAQRLFGGTILPGPDKKYLTIPARAEAHGRRAGEFNNLEILFGKNGPYALAERESTELRWRQKTKRKKGVKSVYRYTAAGADRGGGIFYWLVKSVTQEPDPTVLPATDHILATARNAISAHLRSKGLTK
jgi:hypothetical protein